MNLKYTYLYKCTVCGKEGRLCRNGQVFNPNLNLLFLCDTHWAMWSDCIFRIPVRSRRKFITSSAARLRVMDTWKQFRDNFLVLWDSLPMR